MRPLYLAVLLASAAPFVQAQTEHRIVIKNHKFEPAEIRVAAGKKLKLIIENQDRGAEEFESHELNREKVVAGSSTIIVFVGPLKAGRYPFFGEFHMDSAQGALIAE